MPRAPRSCTANSSSVSSTSRAGCSAIAATSSIHSDTGGSSCHRSPSHRSTPNGPITRTVPFGWRWTTVAPIASESTTRSRSDPAGRSNTAHSSAPSAVRISQLEMPSANRRAPFSGIDSTGRSVTTRRVACSHDCGGVVGWMIAPTLGIRRSCRRGRKA